MNAVRWLSLEFGGVRCHSWRRRAIASRLYVARIGCAVYGRASCSFLGDLERLRRSVRAKFALFGDFETVAQKWLGVWVVYPWLYGSCALPDLPRSPSFGDFVRIILDTVRMIGWARDGRSRMLAMVHGDVLMLHGAWA